ncbi:MAG TPA: MarR family transcriptional regulator [Baekduia sp.]
MAAPRTPARSEAATTNESAPPLAATAANAIAPPTRAESRDPMGGDRSGERGQLHLHHRCMHAKLACMQASSAGTEATPAALAAELLDLWRVILKGSTRDLYRLLSEVDLSMTQLKLLHVLDEFEGEVSVKELAEALAMSLPNASRTVDALLQRGLVERREDLEDRRVKRVGVTAQARELIDRVDTARLHGLEDWAAQLSPVQRQALLDALSLLPTDKDPATP